MKFRSEVDQDDYDRHMNALALRINRAVDGEQYFDVASVCTLIAVFAIADGIEADNRKEAHMKIFRFAGRVLEDCGQDARWLPYATLHS
jgi:hypothetical protein